MRVSKYMKYFYYDSNNNKNISMTKTTFLNI